MKSDKQEKIKVSSFIANERSLKKDIEFFYTKRRQKFNMLLTSRTINRYSMNIPKNVHNKGILGDLEPQKTIRFSWLFKYQHFLKKKKSSIFFMVLFVFNFLLRLFHEYKMVFEILFLFIFFSGFWLNFLN